MILRAIVSPFTAGPQSPVGGLFCRKLYHSRRVFQHSFPPPPPPVYLPRLSFTRGRPISFSDPAGSFPRTSIFRAVSTPEGRRSAGLLVRKCARFLYNRHKTACFFTVSVLYYLCMTVQDQQKCPYGSVPFCRCSPHPSRGQQLFENIENLRKHFQHDTARTPHGDSNGTMVAAVILGTEDAARTPHGDNNKFLSWKTTR